MEKQVEKSYKFDDLLQRVLKPTTFSLTKNELKINEYQAFWTFFNSQNPSDYIMKFYLDLIKYIQQMEQSKKLVTKMYSIENLLCTLIAISMNNQIDNEKKKKDLLDHKTQWDQLDKKNKNSSSSASQTIQFSCLCPYSNPILTNFFVLHQEQDEPQFYQNLIGHICFLPDLSKQKFDSLSQDSRMTEYLNAYYQQLNNYTKIIKGENLPHYSVLLEEETICKETGELSFSYQHLLMWIAKQNQNVNRSIHDTIIKYYKALPHIAKDYPDEAEKSAICLLHLTKMLFTFYGNYEIDSVRQVQMQVDIFRRWPYPVGTMASELVSILNNEVKSPGSAFRFYVRNEIPSVDFLEEVQQSEEQSHIQQQQIQIQLQPTTKQQAQQVCQQLEKLSSRQNTDQIKMNDHEEEDQEEKKDSKIQFTKSQKSIIRQPSPKLSQINCQLDKLLTSNNCDLLYQAYIIYDQDCTDEFESNIHYLDSLFRSNKVFSSHIMRLCLTSSMISIGQFAEKQERSHQAGKKDQIQDNSLQDINVYDSLSQLSKKELFMIYSRSLNIIDKCEELDSIYDIRLIQQSTLQDLLREIVDAKPQYGSHNENEIDLIQQQHHLQFDQKFAQDSNKDTMMMYIPEFPNLKFTPIGVQSQPVSQNISKQVSSIDLKLQSTKQFSILIQKAFQDSLKMNLPQHQQPLRFIIYGGDVELFYLVQEIGQMFVKNPKIFIDLDYRIYLVPYKYLTLAKFLAYKDIWYQRYLYIPYRDDILVPKFENCIDKSKYNQDKDYVKEAREKIILPQELKINAMLSYIKEAQRTYKVRVYKIECDWFNADNNDQQVIHMIPDGPNKLKQSNIVQDNTSFQPHTIFFCQYVELGASVEAEIQRQSASFKKDKSELFSYYEMKEKGMIKFQYHSITMITTCTDILGNEYPSEKIEDQQVHSLKINNVYKDYFEGYIPIPNAPYFELTYITYDNAKIYDQNLRQKNLFKKHSTEQLQSAFKALHTSMPCSKIEIIESSNKPFKLLVDGKITSDLKRVVISPVVYEDEKEMEIEFNKNSDLQQNQQQNNGNNLQNLSLPIMTFLPLKV